jgi:hypothetical protein
VRLIVADWNASAIRKLSRAIIHRLVSWLVRFGWKVK